MTQSSAVYSFAIALPVFHEFDYELDASLPVVVGARYRLPFGRSSKIGVMMGPSRCNKPERQLKTAIACLDPEALIPTSLLKMATWLAQYYCQPLGEAIQLCIPKYLQTGRAAAVSRIKIWKAHQVDIEQLQQIKRKAPKQFRLLEALQQHQEGMNALQLRQVNESWHAPLKSLQKKGLVVQHEQEEMSITSCITGLAPELTDEQQAVNQGMTGKMEAFGVHLLQGVTGSGKTEVYLRQIEQVLASNRQVIYLVPEIGLTPQLLQRLSGRLGNRIALSHSAQSDLQRYKSWDQFRRGIAQVMIGTRSALFSQCPDLGLIVIDEEHDASYRQQDGIRYHARDVAIKRAQMLNIPLIMGSATPSIESLFNVQKSHYHLYRLDHRVNRSQAPDIELIDCSQVPLNAGCSAQLLGAIKQHVQKQGQVLLYLNRRGFAPVVMCHECGWLSECHQCDARLTLHQSMNRLICHHCASSQPVPTTCPSCANSEIKHYGVGTEQLEIFLRQRFSSTPIIRIDRDSVTNAKQMQQKMAQVESGEPCILIGTQMLAKGHDYPNITLVGILDSDQALFSSFYRASERLIQTVLQVSGRAGRADKPGQALLQTAFPKHELMKNLCRQSYSQLIDPILQERKLLGFPPYYRAVMFQVDAESLQDSMEKLGQIKNYLQNAESVSEVKLVGPIPALMTRRIGKYRAQLTLLSKEITTLRSILQQVMSKLQKLTHSKKARLTIEVDPLDL